MSKPSYKIYFNGNYVDMINVPVDAKEDYIVRLALQIVCRLEGTTMSSLSGCETAFSSDSDRIDISSV